MFFVYILKAEHFDDLYIGQTNDIHQRLIRHNNGEVNSTKSKRPWKIVCLVKKTTRTESLKLERYLKSLSRERKEEFIKKYGIET